MASLREAILKNIKIFKGVRMSKYLYDVGEC